MRATSARGFIILATVVALAACNPTPSPSPSATGSAASASSAVPTVAATPLLGLANVKVDEGAARQALIPRSGGTVSATASNGTIYTLDVPSGALDADTQVGLYPVTAVSTLPHGTLAAAVQFTPEGLTLAYPATLTIGLAPGVSADKLLGFGYTGDGANPVPQPVVVDGRTATLQVTHFSGAGAGTFAERFGAPGSAAAWPQALYDEFLNPDNTAASIGQVLSDWYHQVVEPQFLACSFIEPAAFAAGQPCDLDGFAALDAEFAYDNWLFALRWAQSRAPVNIGSLLTLSKNEASSHLRAYYFALNLRCRERASGPVDDSPASPLLWAGLALARAHDWAMSWGIATRANELDLETLLNRLCVKVVIDPSRSYSGTHPGESGTLHVPTGITIEANSGSPGPLRHDVPIQVKASWGAAPAIGNAASDGTYETTFAWPAGVDPLRIDVFASISSPNPNIAQIAVFDRITKHPQRLSFTFSSGLDGWSPGVAGPVGSANWGQVTHSSLSGGVVVLDGRGNPASPNSWIFRAFSLPATTTLLKFDVSAELIAGSRTQFRVVIVAGGVSTTLLTTTLSNATNHLSFRTKQIDISQWAGTDVTIYLEQNDNSPSGVQGFDKELYIDNVKIVTG